MTVSPAPDTNAAIVLGIASTALPFAPSREAEAERWLRILRLHGEAGMTLQALGVSEGPLELDQPESDAGPSGADLGGRSDAIAAVTDGAARLAGERGARVLGTRDVLMAVMDFYGAQFNHVLRLHGTDREEVLQRLAAQPAAS